jgi:hypothetical protein
MHIIVSRKVLLTSLVRSKKNKTHSNNKHSLGIKDLSVTSKIRGIMRQENRHLLVLIFLITKTKRRVVVYLDNHIKDQSLMLMH